MNSPFVALAWVMWVAHRLPTTDFSPAKEQISAGDFRHDKSPVRGKAGCPHRFYPGHTWSGQGLCSTNTQLLLPHGQSGKPGTTMSCQGSFRSRGCLLHWENCWNATRKQTNYGEIKWSLEGSVFVPEMWFEQSGLYSLQLEAVLCDSDAQPKPVITGQIPLVNIYRKQTRL